VRSVLYDVEWQRLRISCLADRHKDGGWTTQEGVDDNLKRIEVYLHAARSYGESQVRKYRINNALNAVVMGYNGQGRAGSKQHRTVVNWRVENVSNYMTPFVRLASDAWDWDRVKTDLKRFWDDMNTLDEYYFLLDNLKGRQKHKATATSRLELDLFIRLMEQVKGGK
jgi:hypothetical protein